jgi:hypothetical protein
MYGLSVARQEVQGLHGDTRTINAVPEPPAGLSKKKLARPKRFELLTPRFVVWCSIQLSYGRVLRGAGVARKVRQRRD